MLIIVDPLTFFESFLVILDQSIQLSQLSQLSHAIFLHGDIDVFGDIANIATFASAFFLLCTFCTFTFQSTNSANSAMSFFHLFLDHLGLFHPFIFSYSLYIVYVFLIHSRSHLPLRCDRSYLYLPIILALTVGSPSADYRVTIGFQPALDRY